MIVFTHIPRTGGTSVRHLMKGRVQPYLEVDSISEFAFLSDDTFIGKAFIATHCGFGFFQRIRQCHDRAIIIREPTERVVSHYRYLRECPANISYASHYAKTQSLEEFLLTENPAVRVGWENTQTWHLVEDKNIFFRRKYEGVSASALLELAIEHLNTYRFVGTTDRLPQFVTAMGQNSEELGRKRATTVVDCDVSASAHYLIAENTSLDQRLYDYVCSMTA